MEYFREINNTRYIINRVFGESETPAKLIENRVLNEKSHILPLTETGGVMYNKTSGSIQAKEVL